LNSNLPPEFIISIVIVLFFGIGLHEYAHCKVAEMAGDPTPRANGRVTLNLFKHFDPMGTFMMIASAFLGFGIGWGKPAPMNPKLMKNPRWDFFSAVIAGPLTNVAQAIVYALIFRLLLKTGTVAYDETVPILLQSFGFLVLYHGVIVNVSLALFNLVPIGPLDGMWILGSFFPEKQRILWYQWNRDVGRIVFVAVVLVSQFTGGGIFLVIRPITKAVFNFLTGLDFS
jgi:Zn-dependent protease